MNSNISKYQQSVERREERKKKRLRYDRIFYSVIAILVIALIVLTTKAFALSTDEVKETAPAPKSEVVAEKEVEKEVEKETEEKVIEVKEVEAPAQPKKVETGFVYNEEIPMPKAHQEYLFELTEQYGLDYVKTLAVIQHESVFDANAINPTNDYGYFQINIINHEHLSELLGTQNAPFDPFVNMEWGTYMLSDLYAYWSEQGYQGQGLDDAVWSSYNKGKAGFLKYGHAETYIHKMKASIQKIESVM